ncbi:MAG: hypothetical protein HY756_11710 [Nitrospirae bacterium]|nr:hypothetical protein [Nitrospirota bacterium]
MCPKLNNNICDIAGIEPDFIECADKKCCLSGKWERCWVYVVELLILSNEKLDVVAV